MVFYVNLEQNMSLFGQILWLGLLSSDISLFLFCVLFHVLIGFELADREIIEAAGDLKYTPNRIFTTPD